MPLQAAQAPIARLRSPASKADTRIASAAGISSAPEAPCSARPAIRIPIVGAAMHTSEVTPKPTSPSVKTRRSP